jgi:hypothetical protein
MKVGFEMALSALKSQALRLLRPENKEVSQFLQVLRAWASECGPGFIFLFSDGHAPSIRDLLQKATASSFGFVSSR